MSMPRPPDAQRRQEREGLEPEEHSPSSLHGIIGAGEADSGPESASDCEAQQAHLLIMKRLGVARARLDPTSYKLRMEFSDDAPARCRGLNAALQRYGALMGPGPDGRGWLALGPAPEWIFCRARPAEVRSRVEEADARFQRMAAERIEAVRVECALKALGRNHAVELTGDYRYVWREF